MQFTHFSLKEFRGSATFQWKPKVLGWSVGRTEANHLISQLRAVQSWSSKASLSTPSLKQLSKALTLKIFLFAVHWISTVDRIETPQQSIDWKGGPTNRSNSVNSVCWWCGAPSDKGAIHPTYSTCLGGVMPPTKLGAHPSTLQHRPTVRPWTSRNCVVNWLIPPILLAGNHGLQGKSKLSFTCNLCVQSQSKQLCCWCRISAWVSNYRHIFWMFNIFNLPFGVLKDGWR